jgi:hypothetical protein
MALPGATGKGSPHPEVMVVVAFGGVSASSSGRHCAVPVATCPMGRCVVENQPLQ